MSGGNMSVTGGYLVSGGRADQEAVLTGGTLGIYGATMGCSSGGVATPLPVMEVAGPAALLSVIGSPSFV